ncbi:MAG TPA: FkbM family methyltransferase [Bryobacteraceae bacterium]|nr:FkbM family methyltransferase [Bryobacteraceae bacterium]
MDNDGAKHDLAVGYNGHVIHAPHHDGWVPACTTYVILVHLGAEDVRRQLIDLGVSPDRIVHWWTLWQHFNALKLPAWADVPPHPETWLDAWSDEASRQVVRDAYGFFKTYSDRTATYKPRPSYSLPEDIYFDFTLYRPREDESFLDCGAYDGDTMLEFRKRYDMYQASVFTIEANPGNFEKLNAIQSKLLPECRRRLCALVGDPAVKSVRINGSGVSARIDDQGIEVPAAMIDELCRYHLTSLWKLDIEGAELEALRGGVETIRRDRPVIACCLYHRPSDLWTIPAFLASVCENYRFYARCYEDMGWETVLYAVPIERCL